MDAGFCSSRSKWIFLEMGKVHQRTKGRESIIVQTGQVRLNSASQVPF
jgi:hypothetical protein